MTYVVKVTSQGQISIPAPIRKKHQMDKNPNLIVEDKGVEGIVVKVVPDIMSLAGIFKTKKKFTHQQERAAFRNYLATRHLRKGNFPFPHKSP